MRDVSVTSDDTGPTPGPDFAVLIDHVLPLLPPYEFSVYLVLLRLAAQQATNTVVVGKRTMSAKLGRGTRSTGGSFAHIDKKLHALADLGFVTIGEATRLGTNYFVRQPHDVPCVREHIAALDGQPVAVGNHFTDSELRHQLFDRDGWRCHYCGDIVRDETATLDHVHPQSTGGGDEPDNLVTACLVCNSIKSGRTYEEAAPLLLERVAARRRESIT